MLTRRDFIQLAAATASMGGFAGNLARAAAQQAITQQSLLEFESLGQVTLLHVTDMHAQLVPLFFREPSVNLGVGEVKGLPPHITGKAFLQEYGIASESPQAYALSSVDYESLAKSLWPNRRG